MVGGGLASIDVAKIINLELYRNALALRGIAVSTVEVFSSVVLMLPVSMRVPSMPERRKWCCAAALEQKKVGRRSVDLIQSA